MTTMGRAERGTGLLGTTIGLAAVVAMLGFAANVALGLWARSTIDSIAYDAARSVATAPGTGTTDASALSARSRAEGEAITSATQLLGPIGNAVQMQFESGDPDWVVLHVRAPGVSLLPRVIGGGPVVGSTDRRIMIRREGLR